ncbi:uncharacterized protein Dmoj_GI25621 [Drosophila mojavensis]|uniref:Secreted protein n=1 Tax=Drosophila mojavensis TaxID=7230 RepID=A0A0Q9XJ85_DROMO|nr:uncharacterized protein Dmoj_GI25621 [Drosophila mojavensis]
MSSLCVLWSVTSITLVQLPKSAALFGKFSLVLVAGQIITERRAALKAKHVEMLVFLNHNSWILAEE